MADYSTLYPTLTRKSSPTNPFNAYGAGGGNLDSSTVSGLGTLPTDFGTPGTMTPDWTSVNNLDTTGSGGGGFGGAKTGQAIAGLAPLALSLFAPKDQYNIPGAVNSATKSAQALGVQGQQQYAEGADTLRPVLNYLGKITSGDPQALIEATMPERRRVIDQYDTARQQAQFAPRGGGTSSAVVNANTREAGDLASLGAAARTSGVNAAAQLGTTLTSQGKGAEDASINHLAQLLGPSLNDKQNTEQDTFKTFASIAGLIAMFV